MVSFEEGGAVIAKIIDLGLAKSLDELGAQTAISTPGAFAGTPEFASPEQFAGVPVDIRSDLYSLDRATRPLEAYLVIGLFYADRPPD
jgi:serine/threonine protein kinase